RRSIAAFQCRQRRSRSNTHSPSMLAESTSSKRVSATALRLITRNATLVRSDCRLAMSSTIWMVTLLVAVPTYAADLGAALLLTAGWEAVLEVAEPGKVVIDDPKVV